MEILYPPATAAHCLGDRGKQECLGLRLFAQPDRVSLQALISTGRTKKPTSGSCWLEIPSAKVLAVARGLLATVGLAATTLECTTSGRSCLVLHYSTDEETGEAPTEPPELRCPFCSDAVQAGQEPPSP